MMQLKEIIKKRIRNNKGFTLIEVIAVLVILAIITAVAISRDTASDEANVQSELNTLKAHLRYAQNLAMNEIYDTEAASSQFLTRTRWGINVNGPSYTLIKDVAGVTSTPYSLPGESSAIHSFTGGITASSSSVNPILFDDWGSPYNATTKLTANVTITLTPGSQSITITPETGFIQ